LLVPLVAFVFKKNKMAGFGICIFFVVLDTALLTALNATSDYTGANPYLDTKFFTDLYIKPWTRSIPYFLGVILGASFYYYTNNSDDSFIYNKIKHNPFVRSVLYFLGFGLMFASIFTVFGYTREYGSNWSTAAKTVYATLSTLVFILGLTMWILPALLNRAKLIRFLFIGPILTLLGRATYLVALCHPILMIAIYVTSGQPIYIESYKMFSVFVGHAFLIYLVCTLLFLLIEGPIRSLESIWFDHMFNQNRVENWMTVKSLDKKPKQKEMKKTPIEEIKNDTE